MAKKTILYIAMSQDGFISGENDNLDFLNEYQVEGEDYGYANFISSIDFIVVGRKTYEKVLAMGYPYHNNKKVFVITRNSKESKNENLTFYNGNIKTLICQLKDSTNKHIYCDGGAELASYMLKSNLIDRLILSVIPLKLHKGTLLFENGLAPNAFELRKKEEYKSGLIQYCYELNI
ncbi:MAG TPA: dihydrofolate reductase [Flavobacteriales bacterium]|jgi:dihydrofolate reductase|nr:dihydrofolate reductase [Flavobacteriales bacterium]